MLVNLLERLRNVVHVFAGAEEHGLFEPQGLLAAQEAQTASTDMIRELEQEIVRLKDWSAELERYELKKFYPGTVAYVLKPEMARGEPLHMLCKQCADHTQRSTLQPTGRVELRCPGDDMQGQRPGSQSPNRQGRSRR